MKLKVKMCQGLITYTNQILSEVLAVHLQMVEVEKQILKLSELSTLTMMTNKQLAVASYRLIRVNLEIRGSSTLTVLMLNSTKNHKVSSLELAKVFLRHEHLLFKEGLHSSFAKL